MRHRDRHHRLLIDEIGRRIADPARHRIGEAHVAGEVGIAAGRGRLARDAQHLAAVAVELEQLGDDRDLVQQLGVVGAALLERVLACRRHPADLALELGDRLLHAPGGSLRLVLEPVGQRRLGGAIGDPGLHRAVDGEHEHDEADEGDDIFGEQALAQKPGLVFRSRHPDPLAPRPTPALWAVRAPRLFYHNLGHWTGRGPVKGGCGYPPGTPDGRQGGELSQPAGSLVRSDEELCDEAV